MELRQKSPAASDSNLHHTGDLWRAMDHAQIPTAPGDLLYISIYNHQEYWTALNARMKRALVRAPTLGKWLIVVSFAASLVIKGLIKDLMLRRNPAQRYRDKKKSRGMSMWHDWVDWVGAYPFEVAKPEGLFDFYRKRGFALTRMKTCGGGHGCNEFVFANSQ